MVKFASHTAVKPHFKAKFAYNPHPDLTVKLLFFPVFCCELYAEKYGINKDPLYATNLSPHTMQHIGRVGQSLRWKILQAGRNITAVV